MTVEQLNARKLEIEKEREGHRQRARECAQLINEKQQELNAHNATIFACDGALQDVAHWMGLIEKSAVN